MKPEQKKHKRRDIQGLRGVAIIYVLIFHLYPKLFPHGFLGVDIFFVISGFLITMILRRNEKMTCSDVLVFFQKRIKRIFPGYYLVLLLIVLGGFILLGSTDIQLLKADVLWATGFATNFHKYFQNLDYFAQISSFDFVLHTWSLAAEIQFYLVAPLLVLISKNVVGKYVLCNGLLLCSAYFNITSTGPLQFSSIFSRIWQFMCGGIAYICPTELPYPWVIVVPLLLISPATLLLPLSDTILRFTVTVSSAFIIWANNHHVNSYVLGNSLLYFIGEISYSVYLFHWPIILFLRYTSNVDQLCFKDALIAAELSIVFGFLSYRLVEKSFLESRFRFTVAFIIFSVTAVLSMSLVNVGPESGESSKSEDIYLNVGKQQTRFEKACYQFLDVPYLPVNVTEDMRSKAIQINKGFLRENVPVLKKKYNLPDPMHEKYFVKTGTYIGFPDYYKSNGSLSIVVIGNSFARSAFLPLIGAFRESIKEIRLLCNSACQPFMNSTEYAVGQYKKECPGFLTQSLALIGEMKPDIVFFIFKPMYGVIREISNIETDQQMIAMQNTIDYLSNVTKVILIQMPLPSADKSYSNLLLKVLEKKQSFEGLFMEFPKFRNNTQFARKRMEHLYCDKCVKIYAHRIFCDSKICRVFDPDNLVSFFDRTDHFNPHAQKCLSRLYRDTLLELLVDGRFNDQKTS